MEIGNTLKALEHVTPRIERNLGTGWVRLVSITVGTTEYRYCFGGKLCGPTHWHERCTLYADSGWRFLGACKLAEMLSAHAGIAALTAENDAIFARQAAQEQARISRALDAATGRVSS